MYLLNYGTLFIIYRFICITCALHASEAGVVDWYKPFVGVPLIESQRTSPVFHHISSTDATTRSLLYTATSSNVLTAIEPLTGDVSWRYLFEANDPIISFLAQGDTIVSLSGPGGAHFRIFNASAGHLIVEKRLHSPDTGRLFDPIDLGCDVAFQRGGSNDTAAVSDVFVLSNGHVLTDIDAYTGEIKWTYSTSNIDLIIYSKIVSTADAVYIVGLSKTSDKSYKIHVVAVSPASGEVLETAKIPSVIKNGLTDFHVLSDSSGNSYVVWLQDNEILCITLTQSLNTRAIALKGATFNSIKDIGLSANGLIIAHKTNGYSQVIGVSESGLNAIWDFEDTSSSPHNTKSLYATGCDAEGNNYLVRVFWSNNLARASAHVFAPHLADGKGMLTGITFPFNTASHGIMSHVALDIANSNDMTVDTRLVITTSTGAVQLWHNDKIQWTREESLSEIQVAEYVDIPEQQVTSSQINIARESLGDRLLRHAMDTRKLPSYILGFIKRFATGSYASVKTSAVSDVNSSEPLYRDIFGFRKVIVVATSRGTVYGINSGNGAILWSRLLGLGWAAEVGGHHRPVKMYVTRTVTDGLTPQIVLITQRLADNGLVDTVAFHLEALTGKNVRESATTSNGPLEGDDVVPSEMLDAFMIPGDERTVAIVDTQLQVHLYPEGDERRGALGKIASKIYFPLRGKGRILGHQVTTEPEISGKYMAYSTWVTPFSEGEEIVSLSRRPVETVASLGKVLGDRRTLYKYLNPHLVAVTTISTRPDLPQTCSIYVIDGAKGSILYHAVVPSFTGGCNLFTTIRENWLIYSYYDGVSSTLDGAKWHRIVSVEFYEGNQINEKTKSSETSIYSNTSTTVSYYEETYFFPTAIDALTVTSTRFGIANKDVIVANNRNQIQHFMRRLLDPRRPKRKVTSQEAEEWLIQYDPVIPDDPRRIISHNYPVAKTRHILTSPALLESTSLVFAYGLDLFSSRVAPSNTFDVLSENFNKLQLVLTVTALACAILISKPMVSRKKLRESWYS